MARVNLTIPDEVLAVARSSGMNVSRIAAAALVEEADRLARIEALRAYLAELDEELGPASEADRAAARKWADALPVQPEPSGERRPR